MKSTHLQQSRILINSLPKSGTHLLTKAIELFDYKEYYTNRSYIKKISDAIGFNTPKYFNYRQAKNSLKKKSKTDTRIAIGAFTPYFVNQSTMQYWLNTVPYGQYIQGHIPFNSELNPIITRLNYRHLVIIRDPRAVVASLIPFILNAQSSGMGTHFLYDDFKSMSITQQLHFILEGGHASKANVEVTDFIDVYRSILAWRNDPNCLLIRFEDLIGEQGGGSVSKQKNVVKELATYLNIDFDSKIAAKLNQIYNPSSRTFRIGKIGSWKDSMDAENIEYLIEYCTKICNEAGYR
ncbi:MAG TPA: sulfotransferase [Thioploca sp.]|nr:sulfotransferase [Thioploca sp.]